MLPEQIVYRAINGNHELIELMNEIRGKELDETPVYTNMLPGDFKLTVDAPMIRVTYLNDIGVQYADDKEVMTECNVQVDCWTHTVSQMAKILPVLEKIMNEIGYERYFADRFTDKDSSTNESDQLLMSARRYTNTSSPIY